MKISFLVTYYNQEQYVKQSLDSILAIEKPGDWEILVGDDGSSDSTVQLVNEYIAQDPNHIRLFIMPRDNNRQYDPVKRASANRLNLLEKCTGDCFCTLDGDDLYTDTQFIKDALSVFTDNSDVSIVAFGYQEYRDGVFEKTHLLPAGDRQRVDTKRYISSWYLHAGACVHRILWDQERIKYLKTVGYYDDNDIMMNSLNYGDMYFVNRTIYAYRQTGTSIYTSMGALDKYLLNVLGYDVEKKLVKEQYHEALLLRYGSQIINLFLWRKRIGASASKEKMLLYMETAKQIEGSVFCGMIDYEELEAHERENNKKIILGIMRKAPLMVIKQTVKYWLSEVLN